ncbi:NAD(P)H-dependent oxidoreductase [Lunatimonas salinarum]|uniref:NAD(P)H-dependent oxidoreductase n=1 Tax=Lunatimonas salinarum TaxID=1774590 RepID=UPI001ADF24EF|nr:NAD(P)H-dependent oxidoreductase [Lunatimonas salinarum]
MTAPKRILLLFFHPRFEDSKANSILLQEISNLKDVTVKDLYELYPDFNIDVDLEKRDLEAHDVMVWMHPFYWYSCPPLMKQWIDLVLEIGWAYGPNGNKLKNKWVLQVITAGGDFEIYQKNGRNRFTFRELLAPFNQTVYLCQMLYLPPFIIPSASRQLESDLIAYGGKLKEILTLVKHPDVDAHKLLNIDYLNHLNTERWKETFFKTP